MHMFEQQILLIESKILNNFAGTHLWVQNFKTINLWKTNNIRASLHLARLFDYFCGNDKSS